MKEISITRLHTTLEELYTEKKQLRAYLKLPNKTIEFSVVLKGFDEQPDCYIGSWIANHKFRTTQGRNRKRYSTIKSLEGAIKTEIKKYYNCSNITFTLSDEIDII